MLMWLHFQQYRLGYAPRQVQEQDLDQLLDDLGNLWMMVRAVCEEDLKTNFDNREGGENIIPRLLLAVDVKSGVILETEMLSPADDPCASLFEMISQISWSYAKPTIIEICDAEIESYIADFCKQVGIRLVVKKQLKGITQARRMYLER